MEVVKVKPLLSLPSACFYEGICTEDVRTRGREKNHYNGRKRIELSGLFSWGGCVVVGCHGKGAAGVVCRSQF